jgi:hypothetical protein
VSRSGRTVRLIATSWSDNPRKGSEILEWLDHNLDRGRFALTPRALLGSVRACACSRPSRRTRWPRSFAATISTSPRVGTIPCSNAVLEALAAPSAAYLDSGGHPELGQGRTSFTENEALPELLGASRRRDRGAARPYSIQSLTDVVDRHLDVLSGSSTIAATVQRRSR